MFTLECDNETWDYAFINPDAVLSIDDREHFLRETVRLYRSGRKAKSIKGKDFEGRVERKNYALIGGISGHLFEAELETNKGKRNASVILLEQFNSDWN